MQIDLVSLLRLILRSDLSILLIFFGAVFVGIGIAKRIPRVDKIDTLGRRLSIGVGLLLLVTGIAIAIVPGLANTEPNPATNQSPEPSGDATPDTPARGTAVPTNGVPSKVSEIVFFINFSNQITPVDTTPVGTTTVTGRIELPPVQCPYAFNVDMRISVTDSPAEVTYQFLINQRVESEETIQFNKSTSKLIEKQPIIKRSGSYRFTIRIRAPADNIINRKTTELIIITCRDE